MRCCDTRPSVCHQPQPSHRITVGKTKKMRNGTVSQQLSLCVCPSSHGIYSVSDSRVHVSFVCFVMMMWWVLLSFVNRSCMMLHPFFSHLGRDQQKNVRAKSRGPRHGKWLIIYHCWWGVPTLFLRQKILSPRTVVEDASFLGHNEQPVRTRWLLYRQPCLPFLALSTVRMPSQTTIKGSSNTATWRLTMNSEPIFSHI
jgi:hypothetical protein